MDDEWKDCDVVENIRSPKVPGFLIRARLERDRPEDGRLEAAQALVQEAWREFVKILNEGAGYEQLLTLRDNLEARKERFSEEVEKWEDREDWLGQLKGKYIQELEERTGAVHTVLWWTHNVRDPIEQLDSSVTTLADQPIVEAFVNYDDDGRLRDWPDLRDGWLISTGTISQSSDHDTGKVCQSFGYKPEDIDAHRKNTTVCYRLSNAELERAGIDPDNLEYPRTSIEMKPSTTWREALIQIEEREQSLREKRGRPKRMVRVLNFRLRILENVIYRFETFGSVGEMTDEQAQEAARKAVQDNSTPENWEENAAMMHAYFSNHEAPAYLKQIDDKMKEAGPLDSFSFEHTWKTLKAKDWAPSEGKIQSLIEALEQWAPHFEEKYGLSKSVDAARPFEWPFQQDM